jgi:drug/metabolite transporter (DMT)-like permease
MNQDKGRERLGMLLVAVSAILFASKGLFAKALYHRGVGFELLVAVRAVIAVPFFALIAARANSPFHSGHERRAMPWRAIVAAAIAGITCYYVGAMVDFWALTLIDASVERVLLFSYPAIVVLIGSVLKRRAPERRVVFAMLITYAGIWFVMGGIDVREITQNLFGAGLVLIAALTTAIYFLIGERYTHELGSTRFAAIGMSASAVVLALHFVVFRSFDEFSTLRAFDWFLLVVLGVACMFIPGLLQAEGMRRVGAQRASIASTIGPPTTVFLAAIFLHERLNGWQLLGSAMIVGSVLVLSWPRRVVADEP